MTAPDTRWVTRTTGPQPPHIEAAADAIVTATTSRSQSRVIAWLLHDAGLLAQGTPVLPPPGAVGATEPGGEGDGVPQGVVEAQGAVLVCGCGIAPDGAPGAGGCSPQCMEPVPDVEPEVAFERVFSAPPDHCDPGAGYHSTPHKGCILR